MADLALALWPKTPINQPAGRANRAGACRLHFFPIAAKRGGRDSRAKNLTAAQCRMLDTGAAVSAKPIRQAG